jgi:hypothetical protein
MARQLKPTFDYGDAWKEENVVALTVAKAMNLDVLTTFTEAVHRAGQEGMPFRRFVQEIEPRLLKLGWWSIQPMTGPKTGETLRCAARQPAPAAGELPHQPDRGPQRRPLGTPAEYFLGGTGLSTPTDCC